MSFILSFFGVIFGIIVAFFIIVFILYIKFKNMVGESNAKSLLSAIKNTKDLAYEEYSRPKNVIRYD